MKRMIKMVVFYNDGTYAEISAEKQHKEKKEKSAEKRREKELKKELTAAETFVVGNEEMVEESVEQAKLNTFFNRFNHTN